MEYKATKEQTEAMTAWFRKREERINRVKNQLRRLGIDPEDLVEMIEEYNLQ